MSNCLDSFRTCRKLRVAGHELDYYSLPALEGSVERLPFSLRILLENLLRHEDGKAVTADDIEALLAWEPMAQPQQEVAFTPARVILQDFTGVPAVVDLAAIREAMSELGGDPTLINPLVPCELVIDHSVQVDSFATRNALQVNLQREFERNQERYQFLRWGQNSFDNFRVVPPGTGIVHQVNLEYLARVVFESQIGGRRLAYPDTLVGTDSHTTMINGLGVLGWGVGGIEAEAAMLGQPISMLIPQVVGFKLYGKLREGSTATDLVLTITELLRQRGVVGKFVEFYGAGVASLSLADRATLGNMSPEYGATCAIFPIDEETLHYLRFTARDERQVELVEVYAKAQGLFHTPESPEAEYSDYLELHLGQVEPSLAGPKRPQDRISLRRSKTIFNENLASLLQPAGTASGEIAGATRKRVRVRLSEDEFELGDGAIVIAAITSCTNTSNPSVMVAAGLLARQAVARGLQRHPWVKTSLAPGSKVVTEYLDQAGLTPYLNELGFNLVGYGCTTCIGNSGPLPAPISSAIQEHDLVVCSVLSGNRNFEGRISSHVRANYLASPPLVVAYALAGRMDIDLYAEPLGQDQDGQPIFLRDLWPSQQEISSTVARCVKREMFEAKYASVFTGDTTWRELPVPSGRRYHWKDDSTYIKHPPFFAGMSSQPDEYKNIRAMRVLALLGDSVTTDHISPAGAIPQDSPAGRYLMARGVEPRDFNSFGSRRGNHEVMMRGTFGNIRLRNQLVPGLEGGYTRRDPEGDPEAIFDAAMAFQKAGIPLLVLAGREYGSGSSRDWAAKGTRLLGVRVVIAESYERIHRSNLIGMGVLPLQFEAGAGVATLGLTGFETFDLVGLADGLEPGKRLRIDVANPNGTHRHFWVRARVDTPNEVRYYRHGGILHYVLRSLIG